MMAIRRNIQLNKATQTELEFSIAMQESKFLRLKAEIMQKMMDERKRRMQKIKLQQEREEFLQKIRAKRQSKKVDDTPAAKKMSLEEFHKERRKWKDAINEMRRLKMKKETPEEREKRLRDLREKIANETPEERRRRLERINEQHRQRRLSETPEQRLKRLNSMKRSYYKKKGRTMVKKSNRGEKLNDEVRSNEETLESFVNELTCDNLNDHLESTMLSNADEGARCSVDENMAVQEIKVKEEAKVEFQEPVSNVDLIKTEVKEEIGAICDNYSDALSSTQEAKKTVRIDNDAISEKEEDYILLEIPIDIDESSMNLWNLEF